MPPKVEVKKLIRKIITRKLGHQKKANVLQIVQKCAAYQKEQNNS